MSFITTDDGAQIFYTFLGFTRQDATPSEGLIDCIKSFSETDITEAVQKLDVPALIINGDDDQIVPIDTSARLAATLVKGATLKVYPGLSHGLFATHHAMVNADLLEFIQRQKAHVA